MTNMSIWVPPQRDLDCQICGVPSRLYARGPYWFWGLLRLVLVRIRFQIIVLLQAFDYIVFIVFIVFIEVPCTLTSKYSNCSCN